MSLCLYMCNRAAHMMVIFNVKLRDTLALLESVFLLAVYICLIYSLLQTGLYWTLFCKRQHNFLIRETALLYKWPCAAIELFCERTLLDEKGLSLSISNDNRVRAPGEGGQALWELFMCPGNLYRKKQQEEIIMIRPTFRPPTTVMRRRRGNPST